MHKGDELNVHDLFQLALSECGLNGRCYTDEEEARVISKMGEMVCVSLWVPMAFQLHKAGIFSFNKVKSILLPKQVDKIKECLEKDCSGLIPLIETLLNLEQDKSPLGGRIVGRA